uniref:Uncharacterized protein n=1 Tax=Boodleopsis sp. FL1161 TaxID=2364084 RepID=A0A386AZ85_9CHLO|nr:hypothetical protein [Boodleopsis sp. FL1161]
MFYLKTKGVLTTHIKQLYNMEDIVGCIKPGIQISFFPPIYLYAYLEPHLPLSQTKCGFAVQLAYKNRFANVQINLLQQEIGGKLSLLQPKEALRQNVQISLNPNKKLDVFVHNCSSVSVQKTIFDYDSTKKNIIIIV